MRKSIHNNEDGLVLVMVLLVLVAATILGVYVMRMSTTDIKIAGNERAYKEDLFNAETVLSSIENSSLMWLESYPAPGDIITAQLKKSRDLIEPGDDVFELYDVAYPNGSVSSTGRPLQTREYLQRCLASSIAAGAVPDNVTISYVQNAPVPRGSGYSQRIFTQSRYFKVTVENDNHAIEVGVYKPIEASQN